MLQSGAHIEFKTWTETSDYLASVNYHLPSLALYSLIIWTNAILMDAQQIIYVWLCFFSASHYIAAKCWQSDTRTTEQHGMWHWPDTMFTGTEFNLETQQTD